MPSAETLLRRADLLRDQRAHPPLGTHRSRAAVRAGVAGTGETLLVLAWSAAELARERAAGVRLLRRLGVAPGMRVANTLPGALATPGSLLLGDVVEELGALDVPLGDGPPAAAWELVDRVQPDVIVVGEDARAFFAAATAAARPWWRGIVHLRTAQAPAGTPAPPGFTGWERTWLAVPEATSFVAASCRAGRFHPDERAVVEVVDGTLVVTPLDLDAPLPRYATELRARLLPGACPCGEHGPALELA